MREVVVDLSGTLGTISSFLIFLGFWRQILENRRKRKVEGCSLSLIIFGCCSCTFWAVHGWAKPTIYLGVSQTLGVLTAFTILWQWFKYRVPKDPAPIEQEEFA